LSSLALLWTIIALVGVFAMGHGGMMGGGAMGENGMMRGGWMGGMMLHMTLTWVVMLGLVGVFVYLEVSARRERRPGA
jgi:uncharacterized membrane protein